MLVHDFLQRSAQRLPDKVALICDGQRLTYAEIDAAANRLARALVAHGVGRGDRVAIHLPNSVEAVVAIFATLKAGAVFVVVNPGTKPDKLRYVLTNCRARAIVTDGRRRAAGAAAIADAASIGVEILTGAAAPAPAGRVLAYDDIQQRYAADPLPRVNVDLDLACLIYTSGSTGDPKAVMSDHSNVVFACTAITTYLRNVEDDVVLNVAPLSFDYGLYQLLMTCQIGGRLILERSFAYPAAIVERIEQEGVTGFPGVPTTYAMLLGMDLSTYDLSSLRYLTNTAAALPPSHVLELRRRFPATQVYSMYGLTETKRTLYLPPEEVDRRPGSVGIAIPGTEVWIESADGRRLGPGETGELVIRGRHVMRGYWEAPEATARRFRPGPIPGERLCYSGDLFTIDEAGYLYFVARMDDIIKSRGEKVPPKEVETVLYGLPGVREAAVVGVPDPVLGQAVKAYLAGVTTGMSSAAVIAHCRAHLDDYMVPTQVEFLPELPKTASGKIDRLRLALP